MSYSVIISKNKITGLEKGAVTQPKDAVPYSLFLDLSAYVYNISGGTADVSAIKQDLDNLEDFVYNDFYPEFVDLSSAFYDLCANLPNVDELLFDNPPAPTNGSYGSSASDISLNWNPPVQTQAAFNFVNGLNGNSYNFLPYVNDFEFGYRESTSSTYSTISSFTGSYIPINVNKAIITNTNTGSVSAQVTGGNLLEVDLTTSAIGKSYNFRIAYKNNSVDTNWKYLYIPEPSSSVIGFGLPGPAYPPINPLSFTSTDYNNLSISGTGGVAMDTSLNIAYGSSILDIGYGVDISGVKRSNSIQVGGNTSQVQFDASAGFPNQTPYNSKTWSNTLNSIAYPEYKYNTQVGTYYAINSSEDFSNQKIYDTTGISAEKFVRIPDRNDVTSVYNTNISSKNFSPTIQESISSTTALKRTNYTSVSNLYFLSDASLISFKDTTNTEYQLLANYGSPIANPSENNYVVANSLLGLDASGQNLTYIQLEASGNTIYYDISSSYRKGWINQDTDETKTSTYFTLSVSKTKAVENLSDVTRTEGYYLGFDVSNILLQNVDLSSFPDICNNSYQPYNFNIKQILDASGGSKQIFQKSSNFSTARLPIEDTSINNFSVSINNPQLTSGNTQFYGLTLPTSSAAGELTFDVQFDITNLDPTWAPLDGTAARSLYDLSLIYNPTGTTINTDTKNSSWVPSGTNTTYSVNETLIVDYQGNSSDDYFKFPYSRDVSGAGNQFSINLQIENNILRNETVSPVYVQNDLSGGGKAWWWDFTWNILGPVPEIGPTNVPNISISGLTLTPEVKLMETINVLDVSINQFTDVSFGIGFNNTQSINNYTAMWAKDGFYGDSSGGFISNNLNPYIDYNQFYGQSRDYSNLDGSGIDQTIVYGGTTVYYLGGSVTFNYNNLKWFILRLNNQSTGLEANYNMLVDISGLTLGTDYSLFYQEEVITKVSGNEPYGWSVGGLQFFTPWLDAANKNKPTISSLNTFAQGQTNSPSGALNGTNLGTSPASATIKRWRSSDLIYQYLAIGLKPGKVANSISITYS
jgi:hypothetical protein